LTSIEGENELILDYDMSAMRPSYDHNYQFPCTIFFDTKPIKSVQKYGLSENFLPEIDIVHERHKISLGKIVDHYTKAGQFQIMLLVRNNGDKYIYDLDLIDNLPRTAEIHNAGFEYEENIIDEKMKEIIWKIEKIGPREEIEVSYLLNVPEGDYDLQNHEIFIK